MADELAFALINPYTIAKSRTGGVIGRFICRTGLEFLAARMFGPSRELVEEYAASITSRPDGEPKILELLARYVQNEYAPDPDTGHPRRVMLLLFRGENATSKLMDATGSLKSAWGGGDTIRDTYGDYILDDDGKVAYFEPAVLIGPSQERTADILRLWVSYSARDGGLIEQAADVPVQGNVQKTLVLIKPDNFLFPSARPGNIIDLFSRSGLRIIGAKMHSMTVAQAESFYAPVHEILRGKFKDVIAERAVGALEKEFDFRIPPAVRAQLGDALGPVHGEKQFNELVHFMTGHRPDECLTEDDKQAQGRHKCLALVYDGVDAVSKIRNLLGSTDPELAEPGSVRREYGHDVMVNAAHASDSPESAEREMDIVHVEEDLVTPWIEEYYGLE